MADVILDQLETGEISQYYGAKWRPSALVEGAYEAEEFFEHLGESGRWLIFTAAPIKASDGTVGGCHRNVVGYHGQKARSKRNTVAISCVSKRVKTAFPRLFKAAPSPHLF
jgi:hypothetical protein